MSGTRSSSVDPPVPVEVAATLRHDLVMPINLIVGYCELLMGEAVDHGQPARIAPLRQIRSSGNALLHAIDQALLTADPDRRVGSIQDLGRRLLDPAAEVIAASALLVTPERSAGSWPGYAEDLARVEAAGHQMLAMARQLAAGHLDLSSLGGPDQPG